MNLMRGVIQDSKAERVVIDSITALSGSLGEEARIREFIFELGFQLTVIGCTTIMISEVPPMTFKYSPHGVEEFIADGIFLLTEFERKGDLIRALQVIKMRGTKHSRNKYVLKILENGINLVPLFKAGIE
jgi:circadian clock protein KaiC